MRLFPIFLFFTLVGCEPPENTDTEATAEDLETVFDPLAESLQKAREVEDIVLQQKLKMDAALEQMDGESDDPEK